MMIRFQSIVMILVCALQILSSSSLSSQTTIDLSEFQTNPDVTIACVAAEPLVIDPVAMAFDEHQRMWVAENRGYPQSPEGVKAGTIALLQDKDRDGYYEQRTTFASNLNYPNGILPWEEGVIVTDAPDVLFMKDTDGDGVCDIKQVLLTGFDTSRSTQLRVNDPTLGPDGWIYLAGGLSGGRVKAPWQPDEHIVDIRRHDLRFHPYDWRLKPTTGKSQFGLDFDRFGNRFICMNRIQVQQVMTEDSTWGANPHYHFNKTVENLPEERLDDLLKGYNAGARIYPLTQHLTTADSHAGTFTAACAVTIYESNGLPERYFGHVFSCDPTGNLVHFDELIPNGPTYVARRENTQTEFVASNDHWFRPVFLTIGPDGALYVCDMRRKTIEHPDYLPQEIRKRTDFESGRDMGRIYRIKASQSPPEKESFHSTYDPSLLWQFLGRTMSSDNQWKREMALKMLVSELQNHDSRKHLYEANFQFRMATKAEYSLPLYILLKDQLGSQALLHAASEQGPEHIREYLIKTVTQNDLADELRYSPYLPISTSLNLIAERIKTPSIIEDWLFNLFSPEAKEEIVNLNWQTDRNALKGNELNVIYPHKLKSDLDKILTGPSIYNEQVFRSVGIDRELVQILQNSDSPRSTIILNKYLLTSIFGTLIDNKRTQISEWAGRLSGATHSQSASTRFQAALALQHWNNPGRAEALARILVLDSKWEWIRAAALNAAHGQSGSVLSQLLVYPNSLCTWHSLAITPEFVEDTPILQGDGSLLVLEKLAEMAILEDVTSSEILSGLTNRDRPKGYHPDSIGNQETLHSQLSDFRSPSNNAVLFAALLLGMEASGKLPPANQNVPWLGWGSPDQADVWLEVRQRLAEMSLEDLSDEEESVVHRFRVLAGIDSWVWKLHQAVDLHDDALLELVLDATHSKQGQEILDAVLDPTIWNRLPHNARNRFIQSACSNRSHAEAVLQALEDSIIPSGMLNINIRNQWKRLLTEPQQQRLEDILGKQASPDAAASYARYKPAAQLNGNPEIGKVLFSTMCSSCHRLDQEGYALGPDLFGIRNQAKESILLHIVDPNREIASGFEGVEWTTEHEEAYVGLLSFENMDQITLTFPNGLERTFQRNEGGSLRNLPFSFMPEGIIDALSVQQVADLLAYLRGE